MDFISTLGYDLATSRIEDDRRALRGRMRRSRGADASMEPSPAPRPEPGWHHLLVRAHLVHAGGQPVAH
ncbi:hypothetical protein JOD63_001053 [Microbacterium terrae]|uniref:Uncharacterized protein n=1 Tax=Microbacterium terrae TaxID=69369 RepID=A0A0M2H5B0_9MICO|nr:hypothetical protein [Microbacterium terrae]KJL38974.1 hypothetical protein RS81_02386 [Microbacterium terrae]MBP1077085.1 hypothetical protein [Microbacterium terrae]GLJ99680.1 hypothetical protein GCM10017594_28780 [Microbacterium terrae]